METKPVTPLNTLLKAGRLTSEFFCDQYRIIEAARMRYYKSKELQNKYRVHQYSGLAALQSQLGETEESRIGQQIILPALHTGSPRNLYKHNPHAFALGTRYGKFDLFITVTAKPKSEGVLQKLFPGQQPSERPDIVNKVFKSSLHDLLNDIKQGIFGKMKARVCTSVRQMTGLRHALILLLLYETFTDDDIDQIIN